MSLRVRRTRKQALSISQDRTQTGGRLELTPPRTDGRFPTRQAELDDFVSRTPELCRPSGFSILFSWQRRSYPSRHLVCRSSRLLPEAGRIHLFPVAQSAPLARSTCRSLRNPGPWPLHEDSFQVEGRQASEDCGGQVKAPGQLTNTSHSPSLSLLI